MTFELRQKLQSCLGTAYALQRELGGAGMSRVFVAEETAFGRQVVVKVLHTDVAESISAERFKREIRLAARLQHPHIVPVLSAGDTDGLLYYTMPYVDGESLRDRLDREPQLASQDVVAILKDIASALAYAHSNGIVHRDIKPENVLFSANQPLVVDFGIAKALSDSRRDWLDTEERPITLTQLGTGVGTPTYMAPEQAAGDPDTDHRADLYSLGIVAYEMLAGVVPFEGKNARALMAAHATKPPEPILRRRPDMPARLAELVMRLLAKHPADRPASADEVLRQLEDEGRRTAPSRFMKRIAHELRGRWILLGFAAFAAVFLAAALLIHDARATSSPDLHPMVSSIVPPAGARVSQAWDIALSNDGTRLAFAAGIPGSRTSLWVQRLDTIGLTQIGGSEGAVMPFWSGDGLSIGFFQAGELKVVPVSGGPSRVLCPAPQPLGGTFLRDDIVLYVPGPGKPVFRAASQGGECRPALRLGPEEHGHARPTSLQDGRHFVFQSWPGATASLYMASIESSSQTLLHRHAASPTFAEPDRLLFVSDGRLVSQRLDFMRERLDDPAVPIVRPFPDSAGLASYDVGGYATLIIPAPAASAAGAQTFTLIQHWKTWTR